MPLSPLPSATCRNEGCTLTGALSVTTAIRDAISIVHGPPGCAHHTFSLFHGAQSSPWDEPPIIVSSGMGEREVIFGGEDALAAAIHLAVQRSPCAVMVLSTCVAAAIGDDIAAVCADLEQEVPIVHVPCGGFLGGTFNDGVVVALTTLTRLDKSDYPHPGITLVGEKNLEYEAESNYHEICRLLHLLGHHVNLRFVRGATMDDLMRIGSSSLNILREPALTPVGERLCKVHGTPYLPSFPVGLEGTLQFLRDIGECTGRAAEGPVDQEMKGQRLMSETFHDITGRRVGPPREGGEVAEALTVELAETFDLAIHETAPPFPMDGSLPVGTAGISRLLHRWRRMVRA